MRQHSIKMAGFTLLPVILTMTLIAAIAFLLNRDNGMNVNMVSSQMDKDRAHYAAEAGLQAVNAKIQSLGCAGGYPVAGSPVTNSNFGGASYTAYATIPTGTKLTSTGTYNGTSVTLARNSIYIYQPTPKTYTLQPNATAGIDTYITTNSATNRGNSNSLNMSSTNFPLIKFDLSMFPAGSRPVSSTLSLYANGGFLAFTQLYRMTGDWQEGTGASSPVDGANWTTSNGSTPWLTAGGDYHPVIVNTVYGTPGNWLDFDTTDLTTGWLSGSYPNYGMRFTPSTAIGSLNFVSSDDSDAVHRPKITFNYLVPCGTTGPSNPTGGTVTLSPTADSFNDQDKVQENAGAATELRLKYDLGKERRMLIQFDTSSVPSGSTIQSATLRMYVSAISSATSNTKSIWTNALNESWVEGSGNGTNKNCPGTLTPGTSWNYRTNCTNWAFIHPPNTAPAWATMAPMPTARTNLMVAAAGGKIYAIGGWIFTGDVLNTVEEYDPATNTWATKAPMPTARSDAGIAVVNGIIYVIGGAPKTGPALNVNEAYNPATNTWTTKAALPTARKFVAAAASNNKIYVLGGMKTSTYLRNNEEYDPASNTWATKTQMPTARGYFSAQSANDKIYAFGGYAGFTLTTNEEFNPSSNSWTTRAAMPVATDSMSSAAVGNKIYLIAGMNGSSLTNKVWVYDVLNNAYTAQPNYPISDDVPAAAALNGYIYSMGGDNYINTVYKDHYRYDPGIPTPVATASDESTSASPLAASFNKGWINFDLKTLAQEWVDGIRPNYGIVIYTENADDFKINSRENSANKPQLIVTY